jgi:hypothetical protein
MQKFSPVLCLSLLLGGCNGCGEDKPYTPFVVGSITTSSSAWPSESVAEPSEVDAGPPAFKVRPAVAAPAGATKWAFDGKDLVAPTGRAFTHAIAGDFDADGTNEVVAWTVPAAGSAAGAAGELWLYPQKKKLADLPGFVPSGPTCTHESMLSQTGPKSVTLDVNAKCTDKLLPRSPVRAVVVIQPLSTRTTSIALRLADVAPGETLKIAVDSNDQDADGRDDVKVAITVSGTGTERPATAELRWLDRAAGISRSVNEPASSIARAAALELGRSKKKTLAPSVRQGVANVRRLMGTVCAEGSVPRVFLEDGSTIRCGDLGVASDRLLAAEVQSGLAAGDPLAALGALGRDGWYFKKASDKERERLEKTVLKSMTLIESPKVIANGVKVVARKDPRWSPLAFEANGSLLVQGDPDMSRVSLAGETSKADAPSWPLPLARTDGSQISAPVAACDRSEVLLGFAGQQAEATSLLAPRPGSCKGGAAPPMALSPLGFKDEKLEAYLAADHVGPSVSKGEATLRPRVFGSARSPDGRLTVTPVSLGIAVIGGDKGELWRVGDTKPLADCVVADQGNAVACVDGTSVKLWSRP